jgi:hypothetical protein
MLFFFSGNRLENSIAVIPKVTFWNIFDEIITLTFRSVIMPEKNLFPTIFTIIKGTEI